jgi:uncharacterized SAM-binding protein YcdF (DUF218 family)
MIGIFAILLLLIILVILLGLIGVSQLAVRIVKNDRRSYR